MKKSGAIIILLCAARILSAAPLPPNQAYVIKNGLETWTNTGDHLWLSTHLAIGDRVQLVGETGSFARDGQTYEYASVRRSSGDQYWARAEFLSAGSSLAAVKADRADLYGGPNNAAKTGRYISYMAVVTVVPEDASAGFSRIRAYDRIQKVLLADPTYVKTADLTMEAMDVDCAIRYALAIDDPGHRKSILETAMQQYPTTAFLAALRVAAGGASAVGRETEKADGTFAVNDDDVNVRSAPDEKNGFVIARLGKGARVHVMEKTRGVYTVAGDRASWYHIVHPDGWIFGFFLGDAPNIWTLASGVRLDWRMITAMTRIDMRMLAEYDFQTGPGKGWLPLMSCFPVSDLSYPWAAMEAALNEDDIPRAMGNAEEIAAFAAQAGLPAGAADIAGIVQRWAVKTGDERRAARMETFVQSLSGRRSESMEFNQKVPEAILALKPGTLSVGGNEDVQALGFPEIAVRIANMLDLLLKDMTEGPGLAVCTEHPALPPTHKIDAFRKLVADLRTDIDGVGTFMNEEDVGPAVKIASYINGAWGGARAMAKGFCGKLPYATNYKE